ncbi:putative monocarboxylate transporter [Lophiostoma macrostomum CBS 122681]|uniref:Putative monocarboxylate transporter n=1 Tax=Lophiostoma macrostomum CBS 122681 TaxID=1314788 RepID=A0A6A6THY2_9PLEO|nr:putative monocarboxylate transporter [Lophiostoma macrostomum CBS 122681]
MPSHIKEEAQSSPTNIETTNQKKIAWLQVLGAFCLNPRVVVIADLLCRGFLGTYGVYQTYYTTHVLRGFSASAISWIGSVQGFFMFAFSFLNGPVFDAGHLRFLLLTGSFLSLLGCFLTSICRYYWQILLAQGVAMGIGFGCLYLPAPALVSMHFQRNQALAMGISSSGSGIGAVIFPLVFTQLEPRIGFAWATRVLGFILLALSVVPLAIMRFPKSPSGALIDVSALHEPPFILLIGGLLTTFMGIYTMLYYINLFAVQQTSANSNLTSSVLIIVNAASTVGRILPSAVADRIGPIHVLATTALISGGLALCLLAISHAASIVVWAVVFGSTAGAFMGLPAAGVVSVSISSERIGARLGMTLGVVGCGILVAEPIAGAMLGDQETVWVGLIAWSADLMIAGGLFVCVARVSKAGMNFFTVV